MNFFEHQQLARRRTGRLVLLFLLALVLIVLAVNLVAWLVAAQILTPVPDAAVWIELGHWYWVTLATVGVILFGTAQTSYRLRGGGRALAELVGARRIRRNSTDPDEARLVNVVDEMSIASGTPAPLIYVLDNEPGINAFVAGLRPTEAVLVVTKGALETWSRDELQGVIGHEYSHILNGDMRLNVRLMGILAGLLLIGQIGRVLMRSSGRSRGGRGGGQAVLIGLALFVIGYIGIFFGSLIKAAVSRQREFLADASAVQFTRNPDGIAGALWKIRQHVSGSRLYSARADDLSHFCIGESVSAGFISLLATHPPLDDRIRAIKPGFLELADAGQYVPRAGHALPAAAAGFAGGAVTATPAQLVEQVGALPAAGMERAAQLHAAIPQPLLDAVHAPSAACAVVYALLLNAMPEQKRADAEAIIAREDEAETAQAVRTLGAPVATAGAGMRLALINLALPALKELDDVGRARLLTTAEELVRVDGRHSVFEFALLTMLRGHLLADAERRGRPKYFRYAPVLPEIRLLLSVLARVGTRDAEAALSAFRPAMAQFSREFREPLDAEQCTLPALSAALDKLNSLAPLLKKSVIEACADCVIHDGRIRPGEAELLAAVALDLDCPMPPLAAG